MIQRSAFTVAAALLTFALVLVGGVALRLAQPDALATSSTAAAPAAPTEPPPTTPPPPALDIEAVQAQISERDSVTRQTVQEANRQLQEANERLLRAHQEQQRLADELRQAQEQQRRMEAQVQERQAAATAAASAAPPAAPPGVPPVERPVAWAPAAAVQAPPAAAPAPAPSPTPPPAPPEDPAEEAPAEEAPAEVAQPAQPAPPAPPSYAISPEQAVAVALQAAPGASVSRPPELVSYNGTPAYEVTLNLGPIYVDANSGQVLHNAAVPPPTPAPAAPQRITPEQAAAIARDYLGRGTVASVKLSDERGVLAYEVAFTNGSKVYVNATTGDVIYAKAATSKKPKSGEPGKKPRDDDEESDD